MYANIYNIIDAQSLRAARNKIGLRLSYEYSPAYLYLYSAQHTKNIYTSSQDKHKAPETINLCLTTP